MRMSGVKLLETRQEEGLGRGGEGGGEGVDVEINAGKEIYSF